MDFLNAGVSYLLNNVSSQDFLSPMGLVSLLAVREAGSPQWSDLATRLSPEASIIGPGDATFNDSIARWTEWNAPGVSVVVKVSTEEDVQETVRYANEHGIPFLARAGGHGATKAMGAAENTIQIDLRGMDHVDIAADGKTARVGGGTKIKKLVRGLWAAGKQTVTGICECVGVAAPALGGGHGWLQGQYGLAADQIVSARMVLPSGDAVIVSAESNPDLLWAIKGAGHNFGIVTEFQYRLYDVKNPKWSFELFIFSEDKLEALFELTNRMMKTQPPQMTQWTYLAKLPEINAEHPIIMYFFVYDGPVSRAREYSEPVRALGPLSVQQSETPMPDIAQLALMSDDGIGCARGSTGLRFPIGLKSYDVGAVRRVYSEMDKTMHDMPEFSGTLFLLEGYSTQGVQAIDEKSTAFPHRGDEILITPYVMYAPNVTLDPTAMAFGEQLRQFMLDASEEPKRMRAYVNYAIGDESVQALYGWEEWRLEKLRDLKKKWDPENRMRYYNPLI